MDNQINFKLIWTIVGVIVFLFVIAILNPFVQIGAGERGVVMNWGNVQPQILSEGLHFRIPIMQSIKKISVRTQKSEWDEKGADSAGTQDSQRVDVKVAVNWHIDPAKVNKIYQTIGDIDAINSTILDNNVKEALKASTAKYAALDIQKNRDKVVASAMEALQQRVKQYHLIIDGISLTNINFSDEFNNAVEAAQVAQQEAKQAEYRVQTAQNNADAVVKTAEGQASAQKLLQQALTPELLQKMAIDRWNGEFPTYFGGGVLPFLNIGK